MLLPAPGSWKMCFSPAPPPASVGVFRISPSQRGSRSGRGARTWTGARMGQDGTPGNPLMWGGENPEGDPGFLLQFTHQKNKKIKKKREAVDAGEQNAIRFRRPGFIILFSLLY